MPDKRHGKYRLSEPLENLLEVGLIIEGMGMFEWKGKLLSFAFIQNLSIRIILQALRLGSLRHAIKPESMDANHKTQQKAVAER